MAESLLKTITPPQQKNIQIHFYVPPSWQALGAVNGAVLVAGIPVNLITYLSPAYESGGRSDFSLKAVQLPFLIDVQDWLLAYITSNNFSLQGFAKIDEDRAQLQYVFVENGQSYAVRLVGERVDSVLYLAAFRVPVEAWQMERDRAVWAATLLKVESGKQGPGESLVVYNFANTVRFQYPQSWVVLDSPITSLKRMNVALVNAKGGLPQKGSDVKLSDLIMDGRIDVEIIAKDKTNTLVGEVERMRKSLDQSGFVLGDLLEKREVPQHDKAITFSRVDVYKFNDRAQRYVGYELWIGVFETPDHFYITQLLTLGRDANFLIWGRNKAAFEKVIKTLHKNEKL